MTKTYISRLAVFSSMVFFTQAFGADAKPTNTTPANTDEKKDAVSFNAKDVWDVDIFDRDDHKVLVIQDRKYNKAGRLELGLDAGTVSASPYYKTLSYGGHLGYHFNEYWGVEFYGAKYSSTFSAEGKQLNDFFVSKSFATAKEYRQPSFFTSASAVWSPIYGKFAFFRSSIIFFDIYAQAGLSMFSTKGVKDIKQGEDVSENQKPTDQMKVGTLAAVGVRTFINDRWIWRFDIRNNIYPVQYAATTASGKLTNRTQSAFQFTTGVSMLFNVGGF